MDMNNRSECRKRANGRAKIIALLLLLVFPILLLSACKNEVGETNET